MFKILSKKFCLSHRSESNILNADHEEKVAASETRIAEYTIQLEIHEARSGVSHKYNFDIAKCCRTHCKDHFIT